MLRTIKTELRNCKKKTNPTFSKPDNNAKHEKNNARAKPGRLGPEAQCCLPTKGDLALLPQTCHKDLHFRERHQTLWKGIPNEYSTHNKTRRVEFCGCQQAWSPGGLAWEHLIDANHMFSETQRNRIANVGAHALCLVVQCESSFTVLVHIHLLIQRRSITFWILLALFGDPVKWSLHFVFESLDSSFVGDSLDSQICFWKAEV